MNKLATTLALAFLLSSCTSILGFEPCTEEGGVWKHVSRVTCPISPDATVSCTSAPPAWVCDYEPDTPGIQNPEWSDD